MMARTQFSWHTVSVDCTKLRAQSPMTPKSDAVDTPTVIPALKGNGDNLKGGGANDDIQYTALYK